MNQKEGFITVEYILLNASSSTGGRGGGSLVLFAYQGGFEKRAGWDCKKSSTEGASLNSINRNLYFHERTLLYSMRSSCNWLPSGG